MQLEQGQSMKVLLTGKNGQVGFELQRALAPLGEVVAVDHQKCDFCHLESIRRLVRHAKPDLLSAALQF
jgi:dTDP-4-dehydrorhamnose reductase